MNKPRHTVLVIDDEPLILSSLYTLLSDGYEVFTAEEGVSGLSLFARVNPSIVLLDIDLPMMSGPEVLSVIRKVNPHVPVIIMTGRGTVPLEEGRASWIRRCAELGISGYMLKPISPSKLMREIEKAIGFSPIAARSLD